MDNFDNFFKNEENDEFENPSGFPEPSDPEKTGFSSEEADSSFAFDPISTDESGESVEAVSGVEAEDESDDILAAYLNEKADEPGTSEPVLTDRGSQAPFSQPAEPKNYAESSPQAPKPPQPPTQPYNFGQPYSQPIRNQQPPQPPKKSKGGKIAVIIIIAVAVLTALGFLGNRFMKGSNTNPTTLSEVSSTTASTESIAPADTTTSSVQLVDVSNGENLSAVQIAENCRPSVVGVMTYKSGTLEGEGSGVVMGFDSTNKYTYIMTCAHVVSSSGVTYGILTLDGMSYTAELVGYDSKTDIGVLKVEGTDFNVARFGDSTKLRIGETVYAIGNPGGSEYFGSMTEGIVSAIDRNVSGTYNITCIQHDAAINPGNSGGALVNASGQVIGINSSKIADTDYEGMGFAVPSSTATSIAQSLISYGYVPNRPKLGITYDSVSKYQVYSMVVAIKGLPSGSLIITNISDDSALKGTDAKVGDMIIAVNGKNMDSSDVLLDLVDKGAVGDSLTLTLCRIDSRTYKTSTFDVKIALVEDKGSSSETTTEEESIYDFDNGGFGGFGSDFGDFFKNYFGF